MTIESAVVAGLGLTIILRKKRRFLSLKFSNDFEIEYEYSGTTQTKQIYFFSILLLTILWYCNDKIKILAIFSEANDVTGVNDIRCGLRLK